MNNSTQYTELAHDRYPGGKNGAGTFQTIIDLLPEHLFYAELFAGSAAIFRRKPPAMHSVLIDRDPVVARHWTARKLAAVTVVRGDATRWLKKNRQSFNREWVLYVDPPYPLPTRSKKKIYRYEMTINQHRRLLATLNTLDANIVVSSYWSKLYAQELAGWHVRTFMNTTRRGPREEHLWMNFDPDAAPSLSRPYAGNNFRERERVKKKITRHVANFQRLPPWERHSLLSALLESQAALSRKEPHVND